MNTQATDVDPIADPHPYTPTASAGYSNHHGDFARLIPVNEAAHCAFDEVAEKLQCEPDLNPHALSLMHIEELRGDNSKEESGGSDAEASFPQIHYLRTGYYRLSMRLPPRDPSAGWIMGSGRHDVVEQNVDFLLTSKKNQHRVHGTHARLVHNLETYALLLKVYRRCLEPRSFGVVQRSSGASVRSRLRYRPSKKAEKPIIRAKTTRSRVTKAPITRKHGATYPSTGTRAVQTRLRCRRDVTSLMYELDRSGKRAIPISTP